jgi:hypothetical protein
VLRSENHEQGDEQAERRRDLNERRVEAASIVRCVLRDVNRGAAVFAAERQSLEQPQRHEQDWREDAERPVARE